MGSNSRLLELLEQIQTHVTTLHQHLLSTSQPEPSFTSPHPPPSYTGVESSRSSALDSLTELQELLLTPLELLQSKSATDLLSRHALDRFSIYSAIPAGSTKSYVELSRSLRLPLPILRRILRHAISQRIFHEPLPGHVAHTRASLLLARDAHVRDYFATICDEVWPAAARTVDAVERWPYFAGTKDPSKTGYVLAKGRTINETLHDDPVVFGRYNSAMSANVREDRSYSIDHVVENFDWAALGDGERGGGKVVDVAGGNGAVSRALAGSFPGLEFVVQDLGGVVPSSSDTPAAAAAATTPGQGDERITFMIHDMFLPQPILNANLYFFRRVFMEWPDDKAIEILCALKPALKPGHSRILIADVYTPEPGACPLWQERKFRGSDMLALAISNAGSREREEWVELFKAAGSGFEVERITPVKNADTLLVEVGWRGE